MAGAMLMAFICACPPALCRLMRSYRQKSLNLKTSYHTTPTKAPPAPILLRPPLHCRRPWVLRYFALKVAGKSGFVMSRGQGIYLVARNQSTAQALHQNEWLHHWLNEPIAIFPL